MTTLQTLVDIGIAEIEARFYLALLELGPASVRDVAKKAGISRTNAYDVLARLESQGLVRDGVGGGGQSRLIAAEPPELLIDLVDQRRRRAVEILPDLKGLQSAALDKPRVRYFEGLDGIKDVLDSTLEARGCPIFAILSMQDLYTVPGREWMDEHVARRIASGVHMRAIRSASKDLHDLWGNDPRGLRELRFAPEHFVFEMTTYIYNDCVAIISTRREHFAMTIQSAEYATVQRNLFEALWAASRTPPAPAGKKRTPRKQATPAKI